MDLYGRVRRACHVEGVSIREAARIFGLHRETVSKTLRFSVPLGYRRSQPPCRLGHTASDRMCSAATAAASRAPVNFSIHTELFCDSVRL